MNNIEVLKFFADWCVPCKNLNPIYEELKNDYMPKGVTFKQVDIERNSELTEKYNIRSVPTVIILRNGREYGRIMGVNQPKAYTQAIDSALKG